jgi:hypothetical protein
MDWHPFHAVAPIVTSRWGWIRELSDGWKSAIALIGAVAFGAAGGSYFVLVQQDRERFTEGAQTAVSVSQRLDEHIRMTDQMRAEGFRRIESLERSLDVLIVVRDRQRADSTRLNRIECLVEAIAESRPVPVRCGR